MEVETLIVEKAMNDGLAAVQSLESLALFERKEAQTGQRFRSDTQRLEQSHLMGECQCERPKPVSTLCKHGH
jgi:hypothetical protein